jgi:hypothetical protein
MHRYRYFILVFGLIVSLYSCNQASEKTSEESETSTRPDGRKLAKIYCSGCHKFPEPDVLNTTSWQKYMLPRMGQMLGIYAHERQRDSLIEKGPGMKNVLAANIFPEKPQIDSASWAAIQRYYLNESPEQLPTVQKKEIAFGLDQFDVKIPDFTIRPPSSTLVKFSNKNTIYIGDANSKSLLEFDQDLNLITRGNVNEGAVWLAEQQGEIWLTVMGSFSPTDNPSGLLLAIPQGGGQMARLIADNLRRPVHTAYGDLNGDGLTDAVVSEFGKWTGRLSLLINRGNYEFEQQVLINQSGAIRAYIRDFNGDGLQDIMALFGQGNEAIYLLYNKGDGSFRSEQVLQFSSSNGSSFFDLVDYNQDGHLDIVYTAGDNADFNPVLKHYHGIYIFVNDGSNHFEQELFYQLNGAYGASVADYDMDGDMDIAAISFFPDFAGSPEESFVYLQNQGDNTFSASTFEAVNSGRWIVMDAKDYDQDGDKDIILGSLAFEVVNDKNGLLNQWIEQGVPFVILENKAR